MITSKFWKFSLRFWGLPGVESTCLFLQDQCQADVGIILFCLYVAEKGQAVTLEGIQCIKEKSEPWRNNVVKPLRDIRRHLRDIKDREPELYKDIQTAELAAEKCMYQEMENSIAECCRQEEADKGRISLKRYLVDYLALEEKKVMPSIDLLTSIHAPTVDSA